MSNSSEFIANGPKCSCGNRGWFIGNSIYRCSYCGDSIEK